MPFDWNQVVLNNQIRERERQDREAVEGIQRGNPALAADEARWLAGRRKEEAARQEQERHTNLCREYAGFASKRADEARKRGDESRAQIWDQAGANIGRGLWTIAKVIRSDPGIARFAPIQTALNYQAKNVQLPD